MGGHLPKKSESLLDISGARVAIIASMWHAQCVDKMIARAEAELTRVGVSGEAVQVHRLPGSAELPLAARKLFESDPRIDGILAFGVVLTGITSHDASVIAQVTHGFGLVSDRFGKPIINEVIGVRELKDAEARSGNDDANKGLEAVFAFSEYIAWQRKLLRPSGRVGF